MIKKVKNLFDTKAKFWDQKYESDSRLIGRLNKFI